MEVEIDGPLIRNAHLLPERVISEDRVIWVADDGVLTARTPRFLFPDNGFIVTESFDFADGVIVTPLLDPKVGSTVHIVGSYEAQDEKP